MKKRNKNSSSKIIILIIVVVFIYYVGSIFYNRNFNENDTIILMEEKNEQAELDKLKNRPPLNTEIEPPEQSQEVKKEIEPQRESQFEIPNQDCTNQCKNHKEVNKLNYCKQVCGLTSIKKSEEDAENCDKLFGLEKDYCWRDAAINKTDFEKCKKIEDGNIFEQCKNRITEDIIDS